MLFYPSMAKIQVSGKKALALRREKMKKSMIFIMVLGLTVLAVNGTGLSFNNSSAADNVPAMTSPDIVIGIQSDDGSVCIVYLEITDAGRPGPAAASAGADIIHQLPDMTTLALLGLGGLLYHRRKE
jgi:hypothetical protein